MTPESAIEQQRRWGEMVAPDLAKGMPTPSNRLRLVNARLAALRNARFDG